MKKTEQQSTEPLYYIIQPKIKPQHQNMQEIFHIKQNAPSDQTMESQGSEMNPSIDQAEGDGVTPDQMNHNYKEGNDSPAGELENNFKKEGETDILEITEPVEKTSSAEMDIEQEHLQEQIIQLARYPSVVPKPYCKIKILDDWVNCQIESKRGKRIKIRVDDEEIKFIPIEDIQALEILP